MCELRLYHVGYFIVVVVVVIIIIIINNILSTSFSSLFQSQMNWLCAFTYNKRPFIFREFAHFQTHTLFFVWMLFHTHTHREKCDYYSLKRAYSKQSTNKDCCICTCNIHRASSLIYFFSNCI